MKYIKAYEKYGIINEMAEVDVTEVLHRIKSKPGGYSLK